MTMRTLLLNFLRRYRTVIIFVFEKLFRESEPTCLELLILHIFFSVETNFRKIAINQSLLFFRAQQFSFFCDFTILIEQCT